MYQFSINAKGKIQMGLSASQARLLSITARLSDNELHSQQIANSKVRLADKTQEASQEYIDALNTTKLMFTSYDTKGNASQTELTAGFLYQYADMKNQYGISNSSGKLLVNSTDAANFEASNNLHEFVQKYGIELVENPQYPPYLESIYGENYESIHDENNVYKWEEYLYNLTEKDINNLYTICNKAPEEITDADATAFSQTVTKWYNAITTVNNGQFQNYNDIKGSFGSYINTILTLPSITFPDRDDEEFQDVIGNSELSEKFDLASKQCYSNCHPPYSGSGQTCYLHILAYLLDPNSEIRNNGSKSFTTTTGNSFDVSKNMMTGSAIENQREEYPAGSGQYLNSKDMMHEVAQELWDPEKGYMAPKDETDTTTYSSSVAEKLLSNYKWVDTDGDGTPEKTLKTWSERVVDTYYAVANRDALGLDYEQDLLGILDEFQVDMETALSSIFNEERYLTAVKSWQTTMKSWLDSISEVQGEYSEDLDGIPYKIIPDEEDPKTCWYINLWHRMNGEGFEKSNDGKNGTYYKQLDDNLLNSQEWLQYALEHGVVTLEQVRFVEEAEDGTGLENTKWTAITYGSCTDINSVEDEVAIAKAEAEYTRKLNEIETKDKKYDNDIKKLDTEHNALQTEYESVKSVIDKNVERSFKAFS